MQDAYAGSRRCFTEDALQLMCQSGAFAANYWCPSSFSQARWSSDSAYLLEADCKQQITTLHFVPSMLQVFLEEPELKTCNVIKRVICSGEALPFDLQERFFARLDAELRTIFTDRQSSH